MIEVLDRYQNRYVALGDRLGRQVVVGLLLDLGLQLDWGLRTLGLDWQEVRDGRYGRHRHCGDVDEYFGDSAIGTGNPGSEVISWAIRDLGLGSLELLSSLKR